MDKDAIFSSFATFDNIASKVIDDLRITLRRGSKFSMAAHKQDALSSICTLL